MRPPNAYAVFSSHRPLKSVLYSPLLKLTPLHSWGMVGVAKLRLKTKVMTQKAFENLFSNYPLSEHHLFHIFIGKYGI